MSVIAIGDIHGCYTALSTLINKLPYDENDTFVFLGDYVNRGPDTKKTIDFLIDFSKKQKTVFLRGNHEIMMQTAMLNKQRFDEWYFFGGRETLKSYGVSKGKDWALAVGLEHWNFLEALKPYFLYNNYIFVHGGLEPGVLPEKQNSHSLYWKKYITPEKYSAEIKVICGHTSRKNGEIANFDHTICIDTFACGGQWLTALNVDTGEYYQASQSKKTRIGKL